MTASVVALNKNLRRSTGARPAASPVDVAELRRPLATGLALSGLVALAVFGWGSVATLSGAVIAHGIVVVDGSSKKIQHQQGGVIGEILVRDGSRVSAGDLLVKLDGTQARALLGIVTSQLTELVGRKTRLAAERDDRDDLEFPPGFTASGQEAERVASGERRLFHARLGSLNGQKAQLGERIKQNEDEVKGLTLQNSAKAREVALIREELSRVNDLYKRNLLPVTRVLSLQRDETRIEGEIGTLVAQIAKIGGEIAETRLKILAVDQNRFSDAQKELREVEGRIAELQERKIAAEDQLRRVELRAPIDGIIHELSVHTVGGVVNPAEQLMLVVPSSDLLSVEVHIPSTDIDQLKIGRQSMLRFTAFNQRTTPEVEGVVTRLSPDATRDKETGQFYYTARITPDSGELARLTDHKLLPGMPVDAFIETSARTALSYLTKPLTDQFERAFRER
ncbi:MULTISPECIES: HlyD family type I secretion periplasmic adaptor subunit [unclassified Bradyrhizobium]|uniref:HlyD family type I secretion periplasmic adaptor subunit n=1 Tax=unclassified Bradyrhizobium TaxID=2631580 RepID=UPI00048B60B2|nr:MULTISPECIES: HlyD family type I secretion periplasmic adaptor subunit [unclassified Bradyrhizobium]MCK7667454.1 HlyD family type I secretion periplasmic adaptor subunit [Bradyrhizobium sp. 2S1]QIG94456.1 HlyD family type I secretion periplasmic adaptor subunit [Bradyrhizobium sp. 6(2017)]